MLSKYYTQQSFAESYTNNTINIVDRILLNTQY